MSEPVYVVLASDFESNLQSLQIAFDKLTRQFHVHFRPLHPGVDDIEMRRFYVAEASDPLTAVRLVNQLQNIEGVEAAYVKSRDALP
jgi:hypothetical protein